MTFFKLRGLSIFSQTLLMLVGCLIVTQVVAVALIVALPQPRPDFIRMTELADTLANRPSSERSRHFGRGNAEALSVTLRKGAPRQGDLMSNNGLTADLARLIGTNPAQVRLYFSPDQGSFPFGRREEGEVVPMRRGEAMFFKDVIAAVDAGKGWRVIQSPPRPFLNAWQKRAILLFGASLLVVLAFAWLFARRLAEPIRRFADAADQLGRDASGPPVPEQGPAELRTSARALNAMQMRIGDYLRERTAMIGAIAHDLRTPLARIAFRIENAPDAVREPVQRDIEQMREMISATMDFVKGSARPAERRSLQLDALLTRMVTQAREMGQPVSLETRAPGRMTGDSVALERMLQNLIDNALAYGNRADLVLTQGPSEIVITVHDDGPGLPPDMLEAVFDPFTRVDPSRNRDSGGVGLGLTIARSIAQDHGGGLSLVNGRESGLVATVSLPLG